MAIKYLSAEKKAKQKRNRIIITVITTILIITAIVLYLIFNTDFFRTKRGAFIRHLQTTSNAFDTINSVQDKSVSEARKNKKYYLKGSMKINSSANVADSNILDKIRVNMIAKSDYKNEKSNMDISITSDINEISKISVIRDSDYYGVFNSDISSSYISVKNEKIGQFLSDIDFSNAGVFVSDLIKGTKFDLTSNLASSIVNFEVKDVLEESKLQKKYFQKYFKMLKDVSDIAYTKKANDKIVIDGVNHNVTTYILSLNETESANLVKSIVDKITQDSLTMDFITTKLRMMNLSEEYTDINSLNRKLKQFATEYQLNPSRYGKLSISVSEEKQNNVQTVINFGNNSIVINHIKNNNEELSIFKINNSSVKLKKEDAKITMELKTTTDENIERSISIVKEKVGSVNDNNLQYNYNIKYVNGIKSLDLTYNEQYTFGDNVGEIQGFKDSNNVVILNEFNKEQVKSFVDKLKLKINEVYISKGSSIGISLDPIFTF